MELVERTPTGWNKEQADLLRRIALAGGSYAAEECQRGVLEALISANFVRLDGPERVALTEAGLARAGELRSIARRTRNRRKRAATE
jgi:hypothetical protein